MINRIFIPQNKWRSVIQCMIYKNMTFKEPQKREKIFFNFRKGEGSKLLTAKEKLVEKRYDELMDELCKKDTFSKERILKFFTSIKLLNNSVFLNFLEYLVNSNKYQYKDKAYLFNILELSIPYFQIKIQIMNKDELIQLLYAFSTQKAYVDSRYLYNLANTLSNNIIKNKSTFSSQDFLKVMIITKNLDFVHDTLIGTCVNNILNIKELNYTDEQLSTVISLLASLDKRIYIERFANKFFERIKKTENMAIKLEIILHLARLKILVANTFMKYLPDFVEYTNEITTVYQASLALSILRLINVTEESSDYGSIIKKFDGIQPFRLLNHYDTGNIDFYNVMKYLFERSGYHVIYDYLIDFIWVVPFRIEDMSDNKKAVNFLLIFEGDRYQNENGMKNFKNSQMFHIGKVSANISERMLIIDSLCYYNLTLEEQMRYFNEFLGNNIDIPKKQN